MSDPEEGYDDELCYQMHLEHENETLKDRITKLREGILAAKHEGCACDFHLYGMDADLDTDEALDRFDSLVI